MLKPLQKWIKVGNRNSFSGSTQKENHDPDLLQYEVKRGVLELDHA